MSRDWTDACLIRGCFSTPRRLLSDTENLRHLLQVIARSSLPATHYAPVPGANLPYDEASVVEAVTAEGTCTLRRRQQPRWECYVSPQRPHLRLTFHFADKTPPKHWPAMFQLMDEVAAVIEPDFGGMHLSAQFEEPPRERDRKIIDFLFGANADFAEYCDYGITGLCMRNYFGPAWIEQIGRDRLLSLPIAVKELPWGGIRTDLVPNPWDASIDELHEAWRRAMEHLRPAGVIAEWHIKEPEHDITLSKAPNCTVPYIKDWVPPATPTDLTPVSKELDYLNECRDDREVADDVDISGQMLDRAALNDLMTIRLIAEGTSLRGASFAETRLFEACFNRAQLEGANFIEAEIEEADFSDILASHANFEHVVATNCRMTDARLDHAIFTQAKLKDVVFTRTNLDEAALDKVKGPKTSFVDATLRAANLRKSDFSESSFRNADLTGASLDGATLSRADFRGAKLQGASWKGAKLDGARFDPGTEPSVT